MHRKNNSHAANSGLRCVSSQQWMAMWYQRQLTLGQCMHLLMLAGPESDRAGLCYVNGIWQWRPLGRPEQRDCAEVHAYAYLYASEYGLLSPTHCLCTPVTPCTTAGTLVIPITTAPHSDRCDPNKINSCANWQEAKTPIGSLVLANGALFATISSGILWR